MVDLATLTGAIIISLGNDYAGCFSNNDELADKLLAASKATAEPLWRLPLPAEYDKHIDSPIADMKNVGNGRAGGSITAALFLQRFVNGLPWAHLDIASTAGRSPRPCRPSPTAPPGTASACSTGWWPTTTRGDHAGSRAQGAGSRDDPRPAGWTEPGRALPP
jgi:leucyl aminopeptidase